MKQKEYKYHKQLLKLYEEMPDVWCKTSVIRNIIKTTHPDDNKYIDNNARIQYLVGKKFLWKTSYKVPESQGVEIKNRYEKMSNWYSITSKGYMELVNIYGADIIREEDSPVLAKYLLEI